MSNLKKIPIAQTTLSNDFTDNYKSEVDSTYQNSHTHGNKSVLDSVSGTNTGDETQSTIKTKLGITTLSGSNTGDQNFCTTKPTATSTASNTNPAVVVQNYLNGTSWYHVWSDGWIEQGGYSTGASGRTVTFLKPFSDTNYTVTMAQIDASYWSASTTIAKTSASSLTINTADSYRPISWIACGY